MSLQGDSLKLRQLSKKLMRLDSLRSTLPPRKGWISEIRRTLGMSAKQLARRLNVSRPAVSQYEKGEADGSITLQTLRNVASALECDLAYALVPRMKLEDMLETQARRIATKMMERVSHTMRLEQQGVAKEETDRQIADLTQQLLADRPRSLWDEPAD